MAKKTNTKKSSSRKKSAKSTKRTTKKRTTKTAKILADKVADMEASAQAEGQEQEQEQDEQGQDASDESVLDGDELPVSEQSTEEGIINVLSKKPAPVGEETLKQYSAEISKAIRKSFRAMSTAEVRAFMKKRYELTQYELKRKWAGSSNVWLELTDGEHTVRCPENPSLYFVLNQ